MQLLLQLKGNLNRLVVIIWMILALIVAAAFFPVFKAEAQDILDETKCYKNVKISSVNPLNSGKLFASRVNDCGPEPLEIEDKNFRKKISDALAQGWRDYGSGKLNLYEDDYTYCNSYKRIYFSDIKENIPGLGNYLFRQKIPNRGITYFEYLAGHKEGSFELNEMQENYEKLNEEQKKSFSSVEVDTSQVYSVLFVYAKGTNSLKHIKQNFFSEFIFGNSSQPGFNAGDIVFVSGKILIDSMEAISFLGAGKTSDTNSWINSISGGAFASGNNFLNFIYNEDSAPEHLAMMIFTNKEYELSESIGCS